MPSVMAVCYMEGKRSPIFFLFMDQSTPGYITVWGAVECRFKPKLHHFDLLQNKQYNKHNKSK